jgi:ribosomal protein L37AE/L43A
MKNGSSIRRENCPVCGSREVERDAVEQVGWLLLAECARCDHRWTQRSDLPSREMVRAAAPLAEVANAA